MKNFVTEGILKYKILIGIIILVIVLANLPQLIGFFQESPDYIYADFSSDKNVYYSYLKQTKQGQVLHANLFTGEQQTRTFFQPVWLVLGWVAGLFNLSGPAGFLTGSIISGIVFILFLYKFLGLFFRSEKSKLFSLLVILTASGLGWVLYLIGRSTCQAPPGEPMLGSIDLCIADSNTFASLAHSPHFTLSLTLILILYWLFLKEIQPSKRSMAWLFVISFFLTLIHPYDLVPMIVVFSVFIFFLFIKGLAVKEELKKLLVVVAGTILPMIYYFVIFFTEPAMGGWAVQNITPTGPFYFYLTGFSWLLISSLFALRKLKLKDNRFFQFLIVWIISQTVLVYLPHNYQSKFLLALHIPWAILGSFGLLYLKGWIKSSLHYPRLSSVIVGLVVVLFSITNLFIIAAQTVSVRKKAFPYYISQAYQDAFAWLEDNSTYEDVILSTPLNGNLIPAYTGRRVYIGHGHQTTNYFNKLSNLYIFFGMDQQLDKTQFLTENKISFLFLTREEYQILQADLSLQEATQKVFANEKIIILTYH